MAVSKNFEKLKRLLEELFQLDQADLDFGIYRIMNTKRDEIVEFLDKKLLPQVQEAFSEYKSADKAEIQKELDTAIEQAKGLGVDPETTSKVKELREKYDDSAVDVVALENEVFSHLYNFFRRYYHEGDFLSQRRYKEGIYAIPYEGEEVKLHWANHDQYYIKSSEYFRDYIFTMPSGKRVRVHLVAATSEKDNKKEQAGNERRFVICGDDPMHEASGELYIRFEYKSDAGKKKQDTLNQEAIERVLKLEGFDEWVRELGKPAPTKSNPSRTVLEKHLTQYTARNTFDYFIHKDLGGFLHRELDFYIKNEVMHLDDIEHDSVDRVEQYLSKIKVVRRIAHKVISFLEQLENFQKRIWLKKKFVIETNYCIALDRIPEEFLSAIAANDAQREEWVKLFAIDEIEEDLTTPGYSNPLTVDFLQAHPAMVVDTQHFSSEFKDSLLGAIADLDSQIEGILIESENSQALGHLTAGLRNRVGCIYIDPPYNTGGDGFAYKDSYQHSSWLAMIAERAETARALLSDDGVTFISIDDGEQAVLRNAMEQVHGAENFVANIVWQKKYAPANDATWLSDDHDFILCFARDKALWQPGRLPRDASQNKAYKNPDDDPRGDWKSGDYKCNKSATERPNLYYAIVNPNNDQEVWPKTNAVWRYNKEQHERNVAENLVWWGKDGLNNVPAYKRFLTDVGDLVPRTIWKYKEVGHTQDGIRQLRALVPETTFTNPKPVALIERVVRVGSADIVLDYFAGSGTTGQAVINLNRADGGSRRFLLVEMGEYFDTLLLPRIKKSYFATDWNDGKPGKERTESEIKGCNGVFKYLRLESYEDALNNLELERTDRQATLLKEADEIEEQYILSYMLDVESRGSQSLLNVDGFRNPDEYKLKVEKDGETQLVNVDLVETFNWLLGLTVKHIDVIRGVRVVEGTNPEGDQVLILWRNIDETDNDALDKWFAKQDYNTKEQVHDIFYINGDNNIENLRRPDQTWKVRLIEEEFQRLMFDVEDV